jgi:hypothetical protein
LIIPQTYDIMRDMENATDNKTRQGWCTTQRLKKILKWTVVVVLGIYLLLVIGRIPHLINKERTAEQVAKIHATKLTLADVMGESLPPDPGDKADLTVEGIDVNKNGIRDDVELAIFKEYPNSAKARAVMLQYALAFQMEMTQPFVNTEIVIAVSQQRSRASGCIGSAVSREDLEKFVKITDEYSDFVQDKQINTDTRDKAEAEFLEHIDSFGDMPGKDCDLNLNDLPN